MSQNTQTMSIRPNFLHAIATFGTIISIIGFGLFAFQISLHILLLLAILLTALSSWSLAGRRFAPIRDAMTHGITQALNAIYIFILIGVLIAALIQSGTVQTLIYYGLKSLSPSIFLPVSLLLCSLMSLMTGTSWGTIGSVGVVLMGIGSAMGIPLPIVAGVIVSGASFGDKMSPISDTTNLAAMSSQVDLYKHIKSMLYTTAPTYVIVFFIFSYLGLDYSNQFVATDQVTTMMSALESNYNISMLTLLPLLIMVVLSFNKVSPEPSMIATSVVAVVLAVFLQGETFISVLNALYSGGGQGTTGLKMLDSLLARGGIQSMLWTLSLALMALALGGILHQFCFLQVLIQRLLKLLTNAVNLVLTTIVSCFVGNLMMGEAYMSIILGGQLYGKSYDEQSIDRSVMSRSIEEGATLTTGLIPWTTGGVFFASVLGVSTLDYAPWALLNWLNPLLSIIFAYFGFAVFYQTAKAKISHS